MPELNGFFGWLGRELEQQYKEILYELGLMVSFQQWNQTENDVDFVQVFNFPFDEGFAFWPITEKVYGKQVDEDAQTVGNCVPYGSCLAVVDRIATELLVFGEPERAFIPFVPFSYGAGRVYVGNVAWTSHGSIGAWQIAADMRYGLLPNDVQGVPARHEFDIQGASNTNSQWMRDKTALDAFAAYAKPLTIGEGTEITSFDNLKVAVVNKKQPVTIASNWGFVSTGVDYKYNIVLHRKGGSWAHQMHIRAVFAIKGQWFVYVGNQWGYNAHPKVGEGFALGGFVITAETFDTWVKEAECYVRGSMNGRTLKPNFSFL